MVVAVNSPKKGRNEVEDFQTGLLCPSKGWQWKKQRTKLTHSKKKTGNQ